MDFENQTSQDDTTLSNRFAMIVPAVGGRLRVLRPQFFFPQLNLKHCVNEQPRADAKRTLFDEEQRRITLEKYIENNFEGRTTKRKNKINDSSNNTKGSIVRYSKGIPLHRHEILCRAGAAAEHSHRSQLAPFSVSV